MTTRHDKTRQEKTRQEKRTEDRTRQDKTRPGKTRHDKTISDTSLSSQDKIRQDQTRQDKAPQRKTRQDRTRRETSCLASCWVYPELLSVCLRFCLTASLRLRHRHLGIHACPAQRLTASLCNPFIPSRWRTGRSRGRSTSYYEVDFPVFYNYLVVSIVGGVLVGFVRVVSGCVVLMSC